MDCVNEARTSDSCDVKCDVIYRNGKPYAKITLLDERTGYFEAIVIVDNKYLEGRKVTGAIMADANKKEIAK